MAPLAHSASGDGEVDHGGGDPRRRATRPNGLCARIASPPGPARCRRPCRSPRTGRDRGHRDAVRAQGPGQRLAERVQPGLARPVGRVAGLAAEGAARGDVDDPAAARAAIMCWTAHQVALAAPVRLHRQRLLPGRLPLLVGHLGDRVRGSRCRRCSPARPGRRARSAASSTMPAHRAGVGQVRLTTVCPAPGQPGQHSGGLRGRPAVVDRDPVALGPRTPAPPRPRCPARPR